MKNIFIFFFLVSQTCFSQELVGTWVVLTPKDNSTHKDTNLFTEIHFKKDSTVFMVDQTDTLGAMDFVMTDEYCTMKYKLDTRTKPYNLFFPITNEETHKLTGWLKATVEFLTPTKISLRFLEDNFGIGTEFISEKNGILVMEKM